MATVPKAMTDWLPLSGIVRENHRQTIMPEADFQQFSSLKAIPPGRSEANIWSVLFRLFNRRAKYHPE